MIYTLSIYYFGLFFAVGILFIGVLWLFKPQLRPMAAGLFHLYLTEFLIVGAIIVPALLGETVFLIVVSLLGLWALHEFYRAVASLSFSALHIAGLVGGAMWLVAGAFLPLDLFPAAIATSLLFVLIIYLVSPVASTSIEAFALTISGWLYPIGCVLCLLTTVRSHEGLVWIVFMYAVLETQDSAALIGGKLFGRVKIFPKLSPNKTWAGVGWGAGIGLTAGWFLGVYLLQRPWPQVISLSFIILVFALLGDLVASKFKRDRQIKDFSRLIKGQGGILDIYDSLLFAAPAVYLYTTVGGI